MINSKDKMQDTFKSSGSSVVKYKDKLVTIITIFKDDGIALVEDADGNIFDVDISLLNI